ncbi:MAG: ABC transporter permease [Deltaproteobacteria bacterium]
MDLPRTWAVFRKEVIHIRRDPFSLLQIILMPIILLLLYGYALTFDIKHVIIAIYDQERSQLSEEFINQFRGSQYFTLKYSIDSYAKLKDLVTRQEVQVGLMLPYDYSFLYKTGKTVPIQALVDGTDSNTANIVLGYVQGVASAYNQHLLLQRLLIKGPARIHMPVAAQTRYWFNEELESRNFIVPSMIAIIMTMVGSMLTALTVVRELERGSLEGLLATPLKKAELLLGKLGPYFFIGMFDMFIVMAMGKFLFQVPLRGDPLFLIGMSAIFMVSTLGQGLLISVSSDNQMQAFQFVMLSSFLPAFFLSGAIFAIYLMPLPLKITTFFVPARYLVTISKGVYLKGIGMKILWPDVLMLLASAVLLVWLSIFKFVKKIR